MGTILVFLVNNGQTFKIPFFLFSIVTVNTTAARNAVSLGDLIALIFGTCSKSSNCRACGFLYGIVGLGVGIDTSKGHATGGLSTS